MKLGRSFPLVSCTYYIHHVGLDAERGEEGGGGGFLVDVGEGG